MYSLIIPVYRNEESIPALIDNVAEMNRQLGGKMECVFVVDGCPDRCYVLLDDALSKASFRAKLILLSRNFGSFAAIRSGLAAASGSYFAVMAADLQEPQSLFMDFYRALESQQVDVAIGVRTKRDDPFVSRLAAELFWGVYRRFIQKEMPSGGVDIFGCNEMFREQLLRITLVAGGMPSGERKSTSVVIDMKCVRCARRQPQRSVPERAIASSPPYPNTN